MSSFEHNEIKAQIHHYLISKTNFLQVKDTMQEDQLRAFVNNAIDKLCNDSGIGHVLRAKAFSAPRYQSALALK